MIGQLPDAARSKLRDRVAAVDREVSPLVGPQATAEARAQNRLRTSWRELVDLLDLGPEPEYRECPVCSRIGMRAATLCGYCWTELSPSGALSG